jgi:hypothetical protein
MCADLAYAAFGNVTAITTPGFSRPGRVACDIDNGRSIELLVHVHGFNGDGEGGATGSFVILSEDVETGAIASEKLGRFLTSVDYFNRAQASVESFDFEKFAKMDQAVKDAFKKVRGFFGLEKN